MSPVSMNRRRLIAASLAVPALAPGALARMRTNEKITLGLIGMGIRGRNMLRRYWLANEGFQVVAVCDVDKNRLDAAKELADMVGRKLQQLLPGASKISRPSIVTDRDQSKALEGLQDLSNFEFHCEGRPVRIVLFEGEPEVAAAG